MSRSGHQCWFKSALLFLPLLLICAELKWSDQTGWSRWYSPPKKLQFQCYWLFASSATVNLHKWLVEHKGEHKPSLRLIGAVRDGCKGKTMQSAKSWEAHWVYRKSLRHTIYLVRVIILSLNKRDAERRKKKFTFYLSIIFGHNLLFLSEFCRRRHGWVWRSDHSALPRSEVNFVSINDSVSQSVSSGGDNASGQEVWGQKTVRRRDRSSSVAPRVCIVSLPVFTPSALWVWRCCCCSSLFPSAAAPQHLLQTGYSANSSKRMRTHSTRHNNVTIPQLVLPQVFFFNIRTYILW